jgi:two-component system sensor histidine kinase HydH
MMTTDWFALVACGGQLALFLLAIGRGARSPLAMPLALLSVSLFSWHFCSLAYAVSRHIQWRWLALAAAPIITPIAVHLVLSFVGRRRSLSWLMYLHYAVFGLFSLNSLLAFILPASRDFVGSPTWAAMLTGLIVPALALVLIFLRIHQNRAVDPSEQARARLLLMAFVLLAALSSTELAHLFGFDVPHLGAVGSLFCNAMLAFVVLRFRLFGRDLSSTAALSALALAALAVLAYLAVFRFLESNTSLLTVGTVTVTLALLALSRRVLVAWAVQRERLRRLATLGRFSAQMAHDLKNPLAALKGAAQYLKEEHAQGRSLADKGEFIDLIVDQIDRLHRVVDQYQRLGRVEPVLQPLKLNELVRSVLALQHFASSSKVRVQAELADGLPECLLDRDLIAGALENMVRNAFEAMPRGGTVTVRTGKADDGMGGVFISVEDTGEGMDARTRERALDDFYTTKPGGTGMGLAFVRRVVEAHGGSLALESREGWGTMVQLTFPPASEHADARSLSFQA